MEKTGGIRLLTENDDGKINAFGKPLIGWLPTSQGFDSLINPHGFAKLRVIVQTKIEKRMEDLYDQPVIIENPGSIVICMANGKFGFVENFRMVGERLPTKNPNKYVKEINNDKRWKELLASLGTNKWELPRGIAVTNETDLNKLALACAKIEASEEAGFEISDAKIIGKVNANSTFFPHSQYIVSAMIDTIGEQKPEKLETIGKIKLFSKKEIRKMVNNGELDDGMSLSTLAIAGINF